MEVEPERFGRWWGRGYGGLVVVVGGHLVFHVSLAVVTVLSNTAEMNCCLAGSRRGGSVVRGVCARARVWVCVCGGRGSAGGLGGRGWTGSEKEQRPVVVVASVSVNVFRPVR